MNIKKVVLAQCLLLIALQEIRAQGCSDAGVCTLGGNSRYKMSDSSQYKRAMNISVQAALAQGENATWLQTTSLGFGLSLSKRVSASVELPYTVAFGKLLTRSGLGDIALATNYLVYQKNHFYWNALLGFKIPTGDANAKKDGRSLPMPYQTTQGTFDILLRSDFTYRSWLFVVGYQHAFNGNNNGYTKKLWEGIEYGESYFESNQLMRGDDLIFRVQKSFMWNNTKILLSILPIIRLQEDRMKDLQGNVVSIKNSNGLTLNGTFFLEQRITSHWNIKAGYAAPFRVRPVRPDGLTKSRTFIIGISWEG